MSLIDKDTNEKWKIVSYKDITKQPSNSPNLSYKSPVSSLNYHSKDDFISAVLDEFSNTNNVNDYTYSFYAGYNQLDIYATDFDNGDRWHITADIERYSFDDCDYYAEGQKVCMSYYHPNIVIDDYDSTLDFIKAGTDQFLDEYEITNYELLIKETELGYRIYLDDQNDLNKVYYFVQIKDIDTGLYYIVVLSKNTDKDKYDEIKEYQSNLVLADFNNEEEFMSAVLDEFKEEKSINEFDISMIGNEKYYITSITIDDEIKQVLQMFVIDLDNGDCWRVSGFTGNE